MRSRCASRRSPTSGRQVWRSKSDFRSLAAHRPAPFAWQAQDLHPSGAAGDATLGAADKGERLLDYGARAFIELLADVDKFDVKRFCLHLGRDR